MNTAQLESITNAAMTLPERERAKLAHDLVASLDGPADLSVAEARDSEICRKINDIESGKTELPGLGEQLVDTFEQATTRLSEPNPPLVPVIGEAAIQAPKARTAALC
jgi:hypothetical protein